MSYSFQIFTVLATLLGHSLLAQRVFTLPFSQAAPFALATMVALLYVGGLFNGLPETSVALYVVGLGWFGVAGLSLLKGRLVDSRLRRNDKVGLFLWLILAGLLYLRVCPSYFSFWDDFASWGHLIDHVYYTKSLSFTPSDNGLIPPHLAHYVRLMGAVHFFFLQTLPFTEGSNLFIAGLLPLTFVSIIFLGRSFWASLMLVLIALTPAVLSTSVFTSLYLDGLMGILFGVLLCFLIENDQKPKRLLLLIPFLIILPNLKEVGFWICYAALAAYILKLLILKQFKHKAPWITLPFLAIIPLLSERSWQLYLHHSGEALTLRPKLSFMAFMDKLIHGFHSPEGLLIHKAFLQAVGTFFIHPCMMATYGILFAAYYLTRQFHAEKLKELTTYLSILTGLFTGYLLFRFSLYHTHFTYNEAIEAASAHRYFSTFALVFGFVGCCYIKQALEIATPQQKKHLRTYGIIAALLGFWAVGWGLTKRPYFSFSQERFSMQAVAEDVKQLDLHRRHALIGFDRFTLLNCIQLGHELSIKNQTHSSLLARCSLQAHHPDAKPLDERFFEQVTARAFKDPTHPTHLEDGYDFLYLATPSAETLQKLGRLMNIAIKPASRYVFEVKKGRLVQVLP